MIGLNGLSGRRIFGPSCDAHCSLGTYFYVDKQKQPHCINHFFDMEDFFKKISRFSPNGSSGSPVKLLSRYMELKKLQNCFKTERAPEELSFKRMIRALDGWADKSVGRQTGWDEYGYDGIFVAGMHFMDASNFNLRRLSRCIVHYITVDGSRIPFCNYNAGLRIRDKEESLRLED
jgi:uncharacterized radical SAM superfamily Fe-S cluster-containing enzyme